MVGSSSRPDVGDAAWKLVMKGDLVSSGTYKTTCGGFCEVTWTGGAVRVLAHYGACTGVGVKRCGCLEKPVDEQSEDLRNAVAACKAIQALFPALRARRDIIDIYYYCYTDLLLQKNCKN